MGFLGRLPGQQLVNDFLLSKSSFHLYHWLETNDYGRFLADNDL